MLKSRPSLDKKHLEAPESEAERPETSKHKPSFSHKPISLSALDDEPDIAIVHNDDCEPISKALDFTGDRKFQFRFLCFHDFVILNFVIFL